MSNFENNFPVLYERLVTLSDFVKLYNVPMKAMYLIDNKLTPTEGLLINIKPKRNKVDKAEELYAKYLLLDNDEYRREQIKYNS